MTSKLTFILAILVYIKYDVFMLPLSCLAKYNLETTLTFHHRRYVL